jgi:DNA-binding MarR family transcriptional regulator
MVKRKTPSGKAGPADGPPFVGALLRHAWQHVRRHLDAAIRANGFDDLQDRHFPIFSWPPPDGVRLSALARQANMSRQAANYLVNQLEEMGYLERNAPAGSERRLIYLTERGRKVVEVTHRTLRALQAQWAEEFGPQRFETFMTVLKELDQRRMSEQARL